MTGKAEFFARVRDEIRKATALFPASVAERSAYPRLLADAVRREITERWPATLERFQQEFERVGGTFYRVARLAQVPALVASIAREREARRVVTWYPSGF